MAASTSSVALASPARTRSACAVASSQRVSAGVGVVGAGRTRSVVSRSESSSSRKKLSPSLLGFPHLDGTSYSRPVGDQRTTLARGRENQPRRVTMGHGHVHHRVPAGLPGHLLARGHRRRRAGSSRSMPRPATRSRRASSARRSSTMPGGSTGPTGPARRWCGGPEGQRCVRGDLGRRARPRGRADPGGDRATRPGQRHTVALQLVGRRPRLGGAHHAALRAGSGRPRWRTRSPRPPPAGVGARLRRHALGRSARHRPRPTWWCGGPTRRCRTPICCR